MRWYGELINMGLPVDHMDVGGGLAVDYDGTHSRNPWSVNYTIGEYAETIVGMMHEFCDAHGLPMPHFVRVRPGADRAPRRADHQCHRRRAAD